MSEQNNGFSSGFGGTSFNSNNDQKNNGSPDFSGLSGSSPSSFGSTFTDDKGVPRKEGDGASFISYSGTTNLEMKEKNPDGFDVDGWEFKKGSKYVICTSFHFLNDLKYMLIPEYFVGELEELYGKSYHHLYWAQCCEFLYNINPIDLNESWDWTDEEKKKIIEAKRIAEEEAERKRQELEERKNTPGYCHLCGAPDAEYIPFEEMYMCKDCYYNMKY